MALTDKRKVFVEEYIKCLNGSEAARRAGYAKPGQEAYRLLRDPEVRAAIDQELEARTLTKSGVLARLTDHALGSIEDFVTDDGRVDLAKMRAAGKLHLIKKLKRTGLEDGISYAEVEIHDSVNALVHLGRYYALFTDKTELSGAVTWRELVEQAAADEDETTPPADEDG